ncbi:hypothetical protein PLICRDRAFT_66226, partial [Plicaturopsis crispa FD-325 SS-3]
YWKATNPPPSIHVEMDPAYLTEFVRAYASDTSFRLRWIDSSKDNSAWHAGRRFFKDNKGLLFFRDADFRPRLCVPASQRMLILKEAHESPLQTAH